MSLNNLDTVQSLAATSTGGEVAISAGAGSGKTRLLVSRYLHLIKKENLPLASIAAITFTNKAADHMKARITEKAYELAEKYPKEQKIWLHVAENAHNAPISTIHSFCSSILRSNPVDAGIDPFFTVIDEVNNTELKNEVINEFVASLLAEKPDDMEFLLDTFNMWGLKKILRVLLNKRTNVVKFLDTIEVSGGMEPEALEKKYEKSLSDQAGKYLFMLEEFHSLRPADDKLSEIHEVITDGFKRICEMLMNDMVDTGFINTLINTINLRGGSSNKWGKKRIIEVKEQLKKCKSYLESLVSFYEKEKNITAKAASLLMKKYKEIDRVFLERKKSERYLDNDDILIETWKLLRTNGKICGGLAQKYRHILVDEFQDTDGIQMDILRMITGNSSASLFTVGDSKQSIFRFRGADVTVFDSFKQDSDSFISLNTNYRSVPSILSFINTIFKNILGDEPEYDFDAVYSQMNPYRVDESKDPSVELYVFDIDGNDIRRMNEAESIAKRAKEIIGDENYGKSYSYGDMALLLRKGTNVSDYEEAFLREGIPFVNKIGGRLSGNPIAYDIGNLLAWLCHPDDSVLLTAVLISPIFNIDPDTLIEIKTLAGSAANIPYFFMNKTEFLSWKIRKTSEILKRLLNMSGRIPVREILERAFDETGYTLTLLADRIVGEQSRAVLDLIMETADVFAKNGGSVKEFADLLLSGEEFTSESARVDTQGNALSIMTIHGAKGLEFKIVFIADITSRGRFDSSEIVFNDNLGPGLYIRDMHRGRLKTYVSSHSETIERKKHIAESKRLFYVACTRAEDRLIISGGPPSKESDDLYEKDNWMNWLHSALSISPDGDISESDNDLFVYNRIRGNSSADTHSLTAYWHEIIENAGKKTEDYYPIETLTTPVKQVPISSIPSHISPNQIIDYIICPALYSLKHVHKLNFRQSDSSADMNGGMGAAYGSYAHRVLEKMNYYDLSELETLVENLAEKSIPESLKLHLIDSLLKFSESDLFARITKTEELCREEPFTFIEHSVSVRGVIDLFFKQDSDLLLVDFKTGKTAPGAENEVTDEHRLQLEIYALALSRSLHVVPSKLVIHYLSSDLSVELPCNQHTIDTISASLHNAFDRMTAGDYRPVISERCEGCQYKELCKT
ncbi:UvrD-helicase domain-containing protein [Candidatus Latescibacterota bacterium]